MPIVKLPDGKTNVIDNFSEYTDYDSDKRTYYSVKSASTLNPNNERTNGSYNSWEKNNSEVLKKYSCSDLMDIEDYRIEIDLKKNDLTKSFVVSGGKFIKKNVNETRNGTSTTLPKGVIIANDSLLIPFQFIDDVVITDRTPSYTPVNIFSRFEPINIWGSSSNVKYSLVLKYVATDPDEYNEVWVEQMASLWKALTMPLYNEGSAWYKPPLKMFLKVGDLIDNIPCVLFNMRRDLEKSYGNTRTKSAVSNNNNQFDSYSQTDYYAENYKKGGSKNRVGIGTTGGHYLPKIQTMNLEFVSSYSMLTNQKIGFDEVLARNEGIPKGSIRG